MSCEAPDAHPRILGEIQFGEIRIDALSFSIKTNLGTSELLLLDEKRIKNLIIKI